MGPDGGRHAHNDAIDARNGRGDTLLARDGHTNAQPVLSHSQSTLSPQHQSTPPPTRAQDRREQVWELAGAGKDERERAVQAAEQRSTAKPPGSEPGWRDPQRLQQGHEGKNPDEAGVSWPDPERAHMTAASGTGIRSAQKNHRTPSTCNSLLARLSVLHSPEEGQEGRSGPRGREFGMTAVFSDAKQDDFDEYAVKGGVGFVLS